MKRTNAPGNDGGRYTEGNPATSVAATVVGASEMNNIQEELVNFILSQGIPLDGGDEEQLIQALNLFVGATANNFGQDFDTTTGLDFGTKAGLLRRANVLIAVSADVTTLADDTTNNVYLDTTTSSEVVATTTGAVPAQGIPLYQIVTVSGAITLVTDQRTQIIDVDSLHESDQTSVGSRDFSDDETITLTASGSGDTPAILLKNAGGTLVATIGTSGTGQTVKLATAGMNHVIKDPSNANLHKVSGGGLVSFDTYGAGSLVTDANGNITASSDSALKDRIKDFPYGGAEINKLRPIFHGWNEASGMERGGDKYPSLLADDVFKVMPEIAPKNIRYVRDFRVIGKDKKTGKDIVEWYNTDKIKSEYHTLIDRGLINALIIAHQDQSAQISELKSDLQAIKDHLNL